MDVEKSILILSIICFGNWVLAMASLFGNVDSGQCRKIAKDVAKAAIGKHLANKHKE